MIDNTFLKMLWIKEYYLKNMDYSNVLYIEPFLNLNVPNFEDIFEEENLNFNFLSWDDLNNDHMFINNFDNWHMFPDSKFDVIISYNYFKLSDFDKIINEIYRILNNDGFFCLFVPYLKGVFNSKISFEYFINKLILLIKRKGFVIHHFSDNSLIKNSDLLEYCLICTKI